MADGYATFMASDPRDRLDLFQETANRMGTLPANVEKDLYVCLTLDMLWNRIDPDGKRFLFKGGTSLSRAYDLISRFSEDVDVTVFGADLGFTLDAAALGRLGVNKRRELLKDMKAKCQAFVTGRMADELSSVCRDLTREAGLPDGSLRIERDTDDNDGQSLFLYYPNVAVDATGYVKPRVLIESGAKSAVDPHVALPISPYVSNELPDLDLTARGITAIDPKRTFGDKVVILHGINEFIRSKGEPMRNGTRLSRHVYDVHMLMERGLGEEVVAEGTLLHSCVEHAIAFFNRPACNLKAAEGGVFSIRPEPEMEAVFRADYQAMKGMIFGKPPEFDDMMESLGRLDAMLNGSPSPRV